MDLPTNAFLESKHLWRREAKGVKDAMDFSSHSQTRCFGLFFLFFFYNNKLDLGLDPKEYSLDLTVVVFYLSPL